MPACQRPRTGPLDVSTRGSSRPVTPARLPPMRAFVITGPREAHVEDVEPPTAAAGQVVVDVERAGVCGTDQEFFTGEMAYLHDGQASYPIRIGHEWVGTVSAVGDG